MEKSPARLEGPMTLEQHLGQRLLEQRQRQAIAEDHRLARARDSEKQRAIDDLTRAAYTSAMIEHGQESLRGRLKNVTSDEERNLEVLTYMMNEQRALDNLIENSSENTLAQTKREKARRFGRKAMNATGAWLSKGNKWQQLAKGVVVGAGASLLAGAIGGAVAAGGIGAVAAAGGTAAVRYGKSYAKGRARGITREASKPELHAKTMNEHLYSTVHQSFARAQELMHIERESLVGKHQDRNMQAHKSAARAVAIGAIAGGILGSMIHFDIDYAHADELVAPPLLDASPNIVMPELEQAEILEPMLINDELVEPEIFIHDTIDVFGVDDEVIQPDILDSADGFKAQMVELDNIVQPSIMEPGILPASPIDEELYQPSIVEDANTISVQTIDEDVFSPELYSGEAQEVPGLADVSSPELLLAKDAFTIESGHGYTHELIEAAKANSIDLSARAAWQAHQTIVDTVGTDYIDLTSGGGMDTYSIGPSPYEVGISAPGEATWSPEAQPIIADLMDDGVINDSIDLSLVHDAEIVPDSDVDTTAGVAEVMDTAEPELELPVVEHGEGIESFVHDEYDHELTHEQSIELGEQLEKAGYAYDSSNLSREWGNPYGINEAGQIDTGFNAIVNDIIGDSGAGEEAGVSTDYTLSSADWSEIETMLENAATTDTLSEVSARGSVLMHDLGPMLKGIIYPDGSSVVSTDMQGNWLFNDSSSPMPQKAFDTIYRYLNMNDTAYDKVQDLLKVL